jgi:hypothetical protein
MAYWSIVQGDALPTLELRLAFEDGLRGSVRLKPAELTGVLARLRDPAYFSRMRIVDGVPTWPGGEELAPDALHEDVRLARTLA